MNDSKHVSLPPPQLSILQNKFYQSAVEYCRPNSPTVTFYIFIQQIDALNILNVLFTLRFYLFKIHFIS